VLTIKATVAPFAAAKIGRIGVTLARGAIGQRKLRPAPSIFPYFPHKVTGLLIRCTVIFAGRAATVLSIAPAVPPLAAAVIDTTWITFGGPSVLEGELGATPTIGPDFAVDKGFGLRY